MKHLVPTGNSLPDRLRSGIFTRTGWMPPERLSGEQWLETATTFIEIKEATPWWWADWWVAGKEGAEGFDLAKVNDPAWRGPNRHTLENYASVARAYLPSRRREGLSLAHHEAALGLPEDQRDSLLDWAEQNKASVAVLRAEKRRRQQLRWGAQDAELAEVPPPAAFDDRVVDARAVDDRVVDDPMEIWRETTRALLDSGVTAEKLVHEVKRLAWLGAA